MERGQKSPVSHRDCAVEHIDLPSGCCELGPIGEGSSASTHPACVANSRADLAQSLAPGHGARRAGLPRLSGGAGAVPAALTTRSDMLLSMLTLASSACAVTTRIASTPATASRSDAASSSGAPSTSQLPLRSTAKSSTKPSLARRSAMMKPHPVRRATFVSELIWRRKNRACVPVTSLAGRQNTGE